MNGFEIRQGRLQASRLVRPALVRHIALVMPKHGKSTPAIREVREAILDLVARDHEALRAEPLSASKR